MAITFRAAGTVGTAATTSVSLSQPTGTTTGDLLLAFVIDHATSGSSAAPTGWTGQGVAAGTGGRFQVFSAIVGSGGLTGTSWSFTGLTSQVEGCITGWFNTDLNVPMDVTVSGRVNARGTTGTTSITPVSANNMVVGGFAALAVNSTLTSPTTATLGSLSNSAVNSSYSTFSTLSVAYVPQAVAGSTGASSVTMSTGGNNAALLLSIKPLTAVDLIGSYVSLAAGVVTATAETDGSVSISGVEAGSNPGIVLASWFPAPQWMYSYPSSELVDAVANDTYPDDYRFLAAGLVKGRLISNIYATERKTLSIWVEIWSSRSSQFVYFFSNANPIPPQPNNSV